MNKTAFTFDDVRVTPDRQIGKHSHPQWELSVVICGAGTRTIGDFTESMKEGEVILIPPNITHIWRFEPLHTDSEGYISNITIFFESSTLDGLSMVIPELNDCIVKLKSMKEALNIQGATRKKVYDLLLSMRNNTPNYRVPKMIQLFQLITDTDKSIPVGSRKEISRMQQRLEKVRAFCNCNYARDITLEDIAAHIGMNKSSFCTFMRRQAGKTLSEFVNDIRLEKAVEMLRDTDENISDIAYYTGFANVTYFNRLFRSKYHCTPKSIRHNQVKEY